MKTKYQDEKDVKRMKDVATQQRCKKRKNFITR